MANELVGAGAWIYDRLTSDATLAGIVATRVYRDFAPEEAPYPFVTFTRRSARDTQPLTGDRALVRAVFRVLVFGKDHGLAALQAAADRIDARLTVRSPGGFTFGGVGFTVYSSRRLEPFDRSDLEHGVRFNSLGGDYELQLSSG